MRYIKTIKKIGIGSLFLCLSLQFLAGCNNKEDLEVGTVLEDTEVETGKTIEGVYQLDTFDQLEQKEESITLSFFSTIHTYEKIMTSEGMSYTLDTGTFSVENGQIQLYSEASDENSGVYILEDDYIILENKLYEGVVTDESAFDGVCRYEGTKTKDEIEFFANRTFKRSYVTKDKETIESTGSYQRIGQVIVLHDENNREIGEYYIYNNQITDEFYKLTDKAPESTVK